jgi:predicted metal-dependent hydrolase
LAGPDHEKLELSEERRLFSLGIDEFNAGNFFEAHEIWEDIWRLTLDKRREQFYRALIQTAVTLELLRRGRAVGVRQVFLTSQKLFKGLPPIFMGLDIAGHIENIRHAIEPALLDLTSREIQIDPARLFQINLLYDPFEEPRDGEISDPGSI